MRCELVPMPDTFKIDPDSRVCRGCHEKTTDHVLKALDHDFMYPCCDTDPCREKAREAMEEVILASPEKFRRMVRKTPRNPWDWIREEVFSSKFFKPDLI